MGAELLRVVPDGLEALILLAVNFDELKVHQSTCGGRMAWFGDLGIIHFTCGAIHELLLRVASVNVR